MVGGTYGVSSTDIWLVKTGAIGNKMWSETHGGSDYDIADSVVQTREGGYAIAGHTKSYGARNEDFLLATTQVTVETGMAMTNLTNNEIVLYRGRNDPHWNYVRVRIWTIQEPTWQFGDINQDGVVDATDLFILSQNYGQTFSLLSLSGIIAVAGVYQYKKRKEPK